MTIGAALDTYRRRLYALADDHDANWRSCDGQRWSAKRRAIAAGIEAAWVAAGSPAWATWAPTDLAFLQPAFWSIYGYTPLCSKRDAKAWVAISHFLREHHAPGAPQPAEAA